MEEKTRLVFGMKQGRWGRAHEPGDSEWERSFAGSTMLLLLMAAFSPNENPGIGHKMKGFFLPSLNLSDSKGGQCMGKAGERREREFKATIIVNK